MDKAEFEGLVEEALRYVPERFREKLENIEVVVEDEPPGGLLKDMGVGRGSTLLGLYHGVPLSKRGFFYGNVLPDRIVLYKGPILRSCASPEELPERVREVVIHEIGHYFGFTDPELDEIEREGGSGP
jgi:predicted Zn-dependent protease with MMP-like domain